MSPGRLSLPIPAHLALRRCLKALSAGNQQQQRLAENTLRRLETGLARAIKGAKNDFIAECAAAYSSHRERDFHGQLIAHRVAVKMLPSGRRCWPHKFQLCSHEPDAGSTFVFCPHAGDGFGNVRVGGEDWTADQE